MNENEPRQPREQKALGRLETARGQVIAEGGAQFNEDGTGFFVVCIGGEMEMVAPCDSAVVRTTGGEAFLVKDLGVASSTSSLPCRYIFTHSRWVASSAGAARGV